jgi:elongation factor G
VLPGSPGSGVQFVNKIVGGSIPAELIAAVESGVNDARLRGILAGYPIDDVSIELNDGSFREGPSPEAAFRIAGAQAFEAAAARAKPMVLEPMMRVRLVVPNEFRVDVLGGLSMRRGRVRSEEDLGGTATIVLALVPLAEMAGYAAELRDRTDGRGTFRTRFEHFEPAPLSVSEEIVARRAPRR